MCKKSPDIEVYQKPSEQDKSKGQPQLLHLPTDPIPKESIIWINENIQASMRSTEEKHGPDLANLHWPKTSYIVQSNRKGQTLIAYTVLLKLHVKPWNQMILKFS